MSMTREEKAERRLRVAELVRSGKSVADVSQEVGLCEEYVRKIAMAHNAIERRRRPNGSPVVGILAMRQASILECLSEGLSSIEIMRKTGATFETVKRMAGLAGVQLPHAPVPKRIPKTTYQIIARLCNTDDSLNSIANDFNLSKQRISQILQKCRRAGIPVHPARGSNNGKGQA